jgi:hypothetical protein
MSLILNGVLYLLIVGIFVMLLLMQRELNRINDSLREIGRTAGRMSERMQK